jgi:hypothetical protein
MEVSVLWNLASPSSESRHLPSLETSDYGTFQSISPSTLAMSTPERRISGLTTETGAAIDRGTSRNGVVESRPMTPVLSHRLKHDKSILALVVSTNCLFAGTEGGEILVMFSETSLSFFLMKLRCIISKPTNESP